MSGSNPIRQLVRFGVFEIDLRQGELRRNGLKVKLREQSFQLLAALLERHGELVTREELRGKRHLGILASPCRPMKNASSSPRSTGRR